MLRTSTMIQPFLECKSLRPLGRGTPRPGLFVRQSMLQVAQSPWEGGTSQPAVICFWSASRSVPLVGGTSRPGLFVRQSMLPVAPSPW